MTMAEDTRVKLFDSSITALMYASEYPEREFDNIATYWKGRKDGYDRGRKTGFEEGYEAAMEEAKKEGVNFGQ